MLEWLLYKRDYTSVKQRQFKNMYLNGIDFSKIQNLLNMKIGEIKPITLIRFFREATKTDSSSQASQ